MSGGQTGVDRAALDVALELGYRAGGWCPRGRRAEDGRIDDRYPLVETASPGYLERTRRNVRDSDGTLILLRGVPEGGTRMTADHAGKLGRPLFIVDFDRAARIGEVRRWLRAHGIVTLNVAGPRASKQPAIYDDAFRFLQRLLRRRPRARTPASQA